MSTSTCIHGPLLPMVQTGSDGSRDIQEVLWLTLGIWQGRAVGDGPCWRMIAPVKGGHGTRGPVCQTAPAFIPPPQNRALCCPEPAGCEESEPCWFEVEGRVTRTPTCSTLVLKISPKTPGARSSPPPLVSPFSSSCAPD